MHSEAPHCAVFSSLQTLLSFQNEEEEVKQQKWDRSEKSEGEGEITARNFS